MGNVINLIGGSKPTQEKTVTAGTAATTVTPDSGKVLSKVTVNPTPTNAENWSNKHRAILNGNSAANTNQTITLKAVTYHDGYWLGVGNDANNYVYKLYTTSLTGNWIVNQLANNRQYPATGIACAGGYVYISCAAGGYSNRVILRQTLDLFKGYGGAYNMVTYADKAFNDVCAVGEDYLGIVGGYNSGAGAVVGSIVASTGVTNAVGMASYIPSAAIKCCDYNGDLFGITSDGLYFALNFPNIDSYRHSSINGATFYTCNKIGDYLAIAATRADGTYIYYAKSSDLFGSFHNIKWSHIKISDSIVTPVGLAYVNGLYVMIYTDSNNKTGYWITTNLDKCKGIFGIMDTNGSLKAVNMQGYGTTLMVNGYVGSFLYKGIFTIT